MNDKQETKKKKAASTETPVHTIRAGSVAASIWRRQSPSGYVYFDFSLARSFKSLSSGNTGGSRNFFARNRHELTEVIDQACRWIEENEDRTAQAETLAA